MMNKLAVVVLVGILLTLAAPFHLGNAYLRSSDFDTVTVKLNESVWSIAERYTTDTSQVHTLMEAIIEVNGLPADGMVRAGQELRVPVLGQELPPQMAAK